MVAGGRLELPTLGLRIPEKDLHQTYPSHKPNKHRGRGRKKCVYELYAKYLPIWISAKSRQKLLEVYNGIGSNPCCLIVEQGTFITFRGWSGALNQFAILFEGRVPMGGLSQNPLTQNPV